MADVEGAKLALVQGEGFQIAEASEVGSWADTAWPLGACHDPLTGDTTFAVHAPAATRVVLELYPTALGSDAQCEFEMVPGRDGVWCAAIAGLKHGALYAFRCWGANWRHDPSWRRGGSRAGFKSDLDADGNRFNPNKVLFDPYAREITHTPLSSLVRRAGASAMAFATGPMPYAGRPSREVDTGRIAPKGILVLDETSTGRRPSASAHNNPSIYEAHVKNLTLHPSSSSLAALLGRTPGFEGVVDVPEELRGTYAGAALMTPYLRALGITTIELMPVHETDTDHEGPTEGTVNHWGYQTIGFFAPNRDYAHDKSPGGPTREFKEMVRAMHAGGIEVVLDVVYNHTGEGGHWYNDLLTTGFTTLGGFATADYYVLTADHHLVDGATGTCNQLNFSSWASRQLVLDSLEYWHSTMGVDGFRFDLAPVLGRDPDPARRDDWGRQRQFFTDHPLLTSVRNLSLVEGFEIIAEPWDLWGNEVGNFPAGWLEWNGRFRDAVRRFLKGDGNTSEFTFEFNGQTLNNGRPGLPRSINFVDAHDGFTMFDLVSFTTKHNHQPYPFGPSDGGADENLSWDSGLDHRLRRTRWRNSWLVVFLARGIPMVVSGDEYGRTQNGNNNPWDLNNVALWNNWAQAGANAPTRVAVDPANPGPVGPSYYDVVGRTDAPARRNPLLVFARYVAHLRRENPALRQAPWGGLLGSNDTPYRFLRPDLQAPPAQGDRALAVAIEGSHAGGDDFLLLVNMWIEPVHFTLPELPCRDGVSRAWARIVDTAPWAERHSNCWTPDRAFQLGSEGYAVQPWSCVLLQAVDGKPSRARRQRRRPRPKAKG